MALVTAQQRQTLRLPTPDASVDSIDQLAFLGIWQVESTQDTISTNQKRWILRLPVVDAAVDELDAWGFLQIPASGGGGNTTDVFSLAWTIDPTWAVSIISANVDGALGPTLSQIIMALQGAAVIAPEAEDVAKLLLTTKGAGISSVVRTESIALQGKSAGTSLVVRTESIALQGKSAGMSLQVKSIESGK